jgi:serine protease
MRTLRTYVAQRGCDARIAAGVLASLLALSGCLEAGPGDGASKQRALDGAAPAHDPRTVIVKFRDVPTAAAVGDVLASVGGTFEDKDFDRRDDRFRHVAGGRLALIELGAGHSVERALATLGKHPAIEYAEPNWVVHVAQVPSDPLFSHLWSLHNDGLHAGVLGADISALAAWEISEGSHDAVVGVVDSGVDYTHPDLAPNMFANPDELANNGIDDDGNGYVDDVFGINAITGTGDPMDDHYHGTHVAGTIGAAGDDGLGVVGVSPNVVIMAMKFISSTGEGDIAGAIACIDYAVAMKNRGVNLRALNNSWGGFPFSQALEAAISDTNDAGILFVAAAGNSAGDNDVTPIYPASYDLPNVVAVAATTRADALSSFSNYGSDTVDLGAPGSDIVSTMPSGGYGADNGTSMAAPHVTGAAALVSSANPSLSVAEVKQILMDTGDPLPALAGRTVSGKRLDVERALEAALAVPAFRVEIPTLHATVEQGEAVTLPIDVTSLLGFTEPVTLSLSSVPALNATTTFTPNPAPAGTSASVSIATTTATETGDYAVTVTGTSGALTRSRTVILTVRPEGSIERIVTSDAPLPIPDGDLSGVHSILTVPDEMSVFAVVVSLDVAHNATSDLRISLTSPAGRAVTLHGSASDLGGEIVATFRLADFAGEPAAGDWDLHLTDSTPLDTGILSSWTLTVVGVAGDPGNHPPAADFTMTTQGLTVSFTDTSTDVDGTIVAWSWNFSGGTSTEQHPSHTYGSSGSFLVTLTVTDDDGISNSVSKIVSVTPIALDVLGARRVGQRGVDVTLGWSGAGSDGVEIYRNFVPLGLKPNTGTYRDRFNSSGQTFIYFVCEPDAACSFLVVAEL